MSESAEKQSKHVEIVIIGAGMSGLSAARHLMKNGRCDFVILEARNRIGGRIVSIDVGSQKVELEQGNTNKDYVTELSFLGGIGSKLDPRCAGQSDV